MEKIVLNSIGYVRHEYSDEEVRKFLTGVEGKIEILEEYSEGLYRIDGFSHLIVVSFLHKTTKNKRKILRVRPRKWIKFGFNESDLPEVGVWGSWTNVDKLGQIYPTSP